MSCKLLRATAFALISCGHTFTCAQEATSVPRLVVSVTIDQLNNDDIQQNKNFLSGNGLKLFLNNGVRYRDIRYNFTPSDKSAVIASICTGATPYFNGIVGKYWFDRNTSKEKNCVDDPNYQGVLTNECCSAESILTTTLSDELKYSTGNKGQVYSISPDKEFAILTAGHNANGAYWISGKNGNWCTTSYYENRIPSWVSRVNEQQRKADTKNSRTTALAIECVKSNSLGKDNITDLLYIYYAPESENRTNEEEYSNFLQRTDSDITRLLAEIGKNVPLDDVLIIITGTGQYPANKDISKSMRHPGGNLYINRSADLLNMYLGAIYGTDRYISGVYSNQIYLNTLLIDKKKIKTSEIAYYAKRFLRQCQGVNNVFYCDDILTGRDSSTDYYRNAYNTKNSGDIIIETSPGWEIVNENNNSIFNPSFSTYQTSITIYNPKLGEKLISQPTEIGSIIESISKILKIRAPNGCRRF